jgi:hypothetical protein
MNDDFPLLALLMYIEGPSISSDGFECESALLESIAREMLAGEAARARKKSKRARRAICSWVPLGDGFSIIFDDPS